MIPIAALLAIAIPLLLGGAVLSGLRRPRPWDPLAYAGYSYVVGATASGLVVLSWLIAGLPLSRVFLNGFLLAAAAAFGALGYARARRATSGPAGSAGVAREAPRWQRGVFGLVVILALGVTCDRALLFNVKPVRDSDEAFIWSSRAKVLFHAGGFGDVFRTELAATDVGSFEFVSHKDYPLLNTLLHLLVYVNAGDITHVENRLPIQAFGLALVLVAAAALRRVANPLVAAALLLILLSETWISQSFTRSAADGMVALGCLCAIDCFLRWRSTGDGSWAFLGGLSLGFLSWSKHEGVLLALLAIMLVLAAGRRHLAAWLVPPCFVVALTWAINARFGFQNDLVQTEPLGATIWSRWLAPLGPRGLEIARRWWSDYVCAPGVSRLLMFPLVLGLLHPGVRACRVVAGAALALIAATAADLWIFAATPRGLAWHWETAGVRVLSQLNPAIALVVGAMTGLMLPSRSTRPDVPGPLGS